MTTAPTHHDDRPVQPIIDLTSIALHRGRWTAVCLRDGCTWRAAALLTRTAAEAAASTHD